SARTGESPPPGLGGVGGLMVKQIPVEAGLVDGVERSEAHRDRRELPEVGEATGGRGAGEAAAKDLAPEPVEVFLVEATLEEGAGVHAGRGVALHVHLVAESAVGLALEEVVETDVVERRR